MDPICTWLTIANRWARVYGGPWMHDANLCAWREHSECFVNPQNRKRRLRYKKLCVSLCIEWIREVSKDKSNVFHAGKTEGLRHLLEYHGFILRVCRAEKFCNGKPGALKTIESFCNIPIEIEWKLRGMMFEKVSMQIFHYLTTQKYMMLRVHVPVSWWWISHVNS